MLCDTRRSVGAGVEPGRKHKRVLFVSVQSVVQGSRFETTESTDGHGWERTGGSGATHPGITESLSCGSCVSWFENPGKILPTKHTKPHENRSGTKTPTSCHDPFHPWSSVKSVVQGSRFETSGFHGWTRMGANRRKQRRSPGDHGIPFVWFVCFVVQKPRKNSAHEPHETTRKQVRHEDSHFLS